MELNIVHNEDCLSGLKTIPDNCIDCCVTSPPYYGLRDYNVDGQIGLEDTPEEYISRLVSVFSEVLRVLKPEGTLWLNIGDTYNGYKGNSNRTNQESMYAGHRHQPARKPNHGLESKALKQKDMIGIPWTLAFALRSIGFYLRQDIIWHKPNPMPEAVRDRCTKSHEYIFLLSKSARYYFDSGAIKEKARTDNRAHRNKRDVWTVPVKASKAIHFATFPPELIRDCVLAGCPVGGVILDPFMGTGTTAMVARQLGRNYVGFEINPDYFEYINQKVQVEQDMFYLTQK